MYSFEILAFLILGLKFSHGMTEFEAFETSMMRCIQEEHLPITTKHDAWQTLLTVPQSQGEKCFHACIGKNQNIIVDHKYHRDNMMELIAKHFAEQKEFKIGENELAILHDMVESCREELESLNLNDDCELAMRISKCKLNRIEELGFDVKTMIKDFIDMEQ